MAPLSQPQWDMWLYLLKSEEMLRHLEMERQNGGASSSVTLALCSTVSRTSFVADINEKTCLAIRKWWKWDEVELYRWAVCQCSCGSGFPVCFQNGPQIHVNDTSLKVPLKVSAYDHVFYVLFTAACCKYQYMWSELFIPHCFGTVLCSVGARMLADVFAIKYFHLSELHVNKCLIANKKYLTAFYDSIIKKQMQVVFLFSVVCWASGFGKNSAIQTYLHSVFCHFTLSTKRIVSMSFHHV